MADDLSEDEPLPARWTAGPVDSCRSRSSQPHAHAVTAVHVIVRCSCGAAYMSTDASLALGMAHRHTERFGSNLDRERDEAVLNGTMDDGEGMPWADYFGRSIDG